MNFRVAPFACGHPDKRKPILRFLPVAKAQIKILNYRGDGDGFPIMPRIMIRCPNTDNVVPTGLNTELIKLDSMKIRVDSVIFAMTVRCTACKMMHEWTYKDAWIEEE
jgi:hypothetical protein